ncbi:hypothetical protein IFM89_017341 [Coptis chinensis]|uniref:Ribosomal RNA-processing protein 12-like conserved domain-containing protein n=1 Tax=Coptis chinensis TaxID=261450 RepID=A0A835H3X2_9MAGN|nr:hypothetical protein IFM89_017341 [Coptis chinensis]
MKVDHHQQQQEEEEEEKMIIEETTLEENKDICQTLMERYNKSSASQHIHLCASAAAMKTILQEEKLPFTPLSYFAATISSINDAIIDYSSSTCQTLPGFDSVSPLASFLSILLPLIPKEALPMNKAANAVDVLVLLMKKQDGNNATLIRSVIKCLGSLVLFCDLKDWSRIKVPFDIILRFSIDKRPKVRKCAQVCIEMVFKAFPGSVVKEASKLFLSLFKSYMPRLIELNVKRSIDDEMLSEPEHLEVFHMLNSVKLIAPYLSKKTSQIILSDLYKLLTCQFSPVTRHIFNILEVFFESSKVEVIVPDADKIIVSLASYVSSGQKNPMDSVMFASRLLKVVMSKLHGREPSVCIRNLPLVFVSIAGLLSFDSVASQAASILKEMVNKHMDGSTLSSEHQEHDEEFMTTEESLAIKSTCAVFEKHLCTLNGVPNEHMLAVISLLFLKLGEHSCIYMNGILLKLAGLMMLAKRDVMETKHLEECIGSAVVTIGPEKTLILIPVSLDLERLTCSNIWFVPILKKYVAGASLEYFLDNIVPLVQSLQQAHRKVKKSSLRKDLQACIGSLWDLLPAFCRYPTDTHQCMLVLLNIFGKGSRVLIYSSDSELVNQNTSILTSTENVSGCIKTSVTFTEEDHNGEFRTVPSHYSKEIATRNIQALASCSVDLLQALTDVFFNSPPKNRKYLKEAIGCLASITESSKVKNLFILSLQKFRVIDIESESEKVEGDGCTLVDKDLGGNAEKEEQEGKRLMIMEFAHSLIAGAKEDLIDTIFNFIKPTLQATTGVGQSEAFLILSRIFEEHEWFYSSRFDEMMDLLHGVKSPVDIMTLRCQFSCFHNLLVYMLKSDLEDRTANAFLILNEIILALKDCNEEPRKAAYDVLLNISDSLHALSSTISGSPHQELFNMILGYLSEAPPPIKSAAIAALSLLIYKNSSFCFLVPELVPSVLILLQSKAKEVIKAVLGFVKVLVSCVQRSDLQNLLPEIVNGILPWSSVSRNHFRLKVTTIFEIIIRKCGYASVGLLVPDRYKGFMKTVKEQRHSKMNSKETETSDTTPKLAVSFEEREKKRRHEIANQGKGTNSPATNTTRTERISKKRKFNKRTADEPNKSTTIAKGRQFVRKANIPHLGTPEGWRTGGSRKPLNRKDCKRGPSTGRKDTFKSKFHIPRKGG